MLEAAPIPLGSDPLRTPSQAAEQLKISKNSLELMTMRKRIGHEIRRGRRVWYRQSDIDRLKAKLLEEAASMPAAPPTPSPAPDNRVGATPQNFLAGTYKMS